MGALCPLPTWFVYCAVSKPINKQIKYPLKGNHETPHDAFIAGTVCFSFSFLVEGKGRGCEASPSGWFEEIASFVFSNFFALLLFALLAPPLPDEL